MVRCTLGQEGLVNGPKYSVIVPVYNERENILPTTEALIQGLGSLAEESEFIFVDDDSPDGTADEIERVSGLHSQVRLAQHGKKEGIGAAHHYGYHQAHGDIIMCIDADLSQQPADLVRMKELIDEGFDMVIGSRYMAGGKQIGKPFMRVLGSRGMNALCRLLLGLRLTDSTHTFRASRRAVHEEVCQRLDGKGHPDFQVQLSFWASRAGFRATEIPITFVERRAESGQSKISVHKEVPRFLGLLGRLMVARFFGGRAITSESGRSGGIPLDTTESG